MPVCVVQANQLGPGFKQTQDIDCGGMPPLVAFSWPYGLIFLAVLFWAFAPEFRIVSRRTEPSTNPQDA